MTSELSTQVDTIRTAKRGRLIANANNSEIAKTLSMIYFMVGLRPQHFPTMEEDQFIFKYIRQNFPEITLEEIYLAFDVAIKGESEVGDVKVYDQFCIEYLVRIIMGYKDYVKKVAKQIPEPRYIEEQKVVVISTEEKLKDIEEFRNKEIDYRILPPYLYDWMVELKIINLEDSDKIKYYGIATKVRLSELKALMDSNPTDKIARRTYSDFYNKYQEGCINLTEAEISDIDKIFKRIVVINNLKNKL